MDPEMKIPALQDAILLRLVGIKRVVGGEVGDWLGRWDDKDT